MNFNHSKLYKELLLTKIKKITITKINIKRRKNMKKSTLIKNKKLLNMNTVLIFVLLFAMLAIVNSGCLNVPGIGEGEESGNTLALDETYDVVRNGVRLIMSYDQKSNSFNGILENTISGILKKVRVEVHLSNGIELGPTTPVDLAPGEKVSVVLPATSQSFDGWTPHAEVGTGGSES